MKDGKILQRKMILKYWVGVIYMNEEIKKKIRVRKILFSIFLILTFILLMGAIFGGIAGADDIINTMAFVFGIPCGITLILTIAFGVKFRRLVKEKKEQEI
jgi:hypothetical protein